MNKKPNDYSDASEVEDYGSPSTEDDRGASSTIGAEDTETAMGQEKPGKYAGGTEGTRQGTNTNEGEQFGEYDHTGTGTDLTAEMESTDAKPYSGLVKGGQPGEDRVAGPAQYGGDAGEVY